MMNDMTIREVLKEFAERFPKNIDNKKDFVEKTSRMYFDYYDGVFAFYYPDYHYEIIERGALRETRDIYTGHGGNNGCMLDEPDYKFIYNNLILGNESFKEWLDKFHMTDKDLMSLHVEWFNSEDTPITDVEVYCSFDFYAKSTEEEDTDDADIRKN